MDPFIIQSVATEHARELRESARRHRDARLAIDRRQRQHRAARAAGAMRPLPVRLRVLAERLGGA